MKFLEPCKTGALLWHGFPDFHLISKLYLENHIRSLIFSMMACFQRMNLFLDLILMHICVNDCYNAPMHRKSLLQEAIFPFGMTYLYSHPVRFNISGNYCKNGPYFQTTFWSYDHGIIHFLMI